MSKTVNTTYIIDTNEGKGSNDLTHDIFVDVSVGGVEEGDILTEGMSLTDIVGAIFTKTFYPTLINGSFSGTTSTPVEVGTPTKLITVNFNRGDIIGNIDNNIWNPSLSQGYRFGVATKYIIDGVDNGVINSLSINRPTILGNNSVGISVDYDAGQQPIDSKGDNYENPAPAGSLNNNVTWVGFYYRTALAQINNPTPQEIRNAPTNQKRNNGGTITLPTGIVATKFHIFLPQSSNLVSVLDTGNLNLDITSEFILEDDDYIGLDAGGNPINYKYYIRTIDNPYTISSNLVITVT